MTKEERRAYDRERQRTYYWANHGKVRAATRARLAQDRLVNPEKYKSTPEKRLRVAAKRQANPDIFRGYELKKKYGLTFSEFDAIARKQGGRCLICNEEPKKLVVDHCHTTGRVRGLLCGGCNSAMGQVKDNPKRLRAAAAYLEAANVSN